MICNTSSAILQFKLPFLFHFGLVLEKFSTEKRRHDFVTTCSRRMGEQSTIEPLDSRQVKNKQGKNKKSFRQTLPTMKV